MKSKGGRAILKRRRQRGRKRLLPKGVEVHFKRHCHPKVKDAAEKKRQRSERKKERRLEFAAKNGGANAGDGAAVSGQ